VGTRQGIRHRLATVLLLGVITSALSLIALVRILSVSSAQRIERGRDAVRDELERLATADASNQGAIPTSNMVGVRSGIRGDERGESVPDGWREALDAATQQSGQRGAFAIVERSSGPNTLVVGARPLPSGRVAWAGYLIPPAVYLHIWRIIVPLLVLATALLVAAAVSTVFTFRKSASALNATLRKLAKDLSTPIPRPSVRELSDVAEGIERMAQELAASRQTQDRMSLELAEQERLAGLGRVVAGVAHEVRNPLASIKLHLDLAMAKTKLPEAAEKAITHASSEISRLDRLVADLLVVAGRKMGPQGPVSVGKLVRGRAEGLAAWAATRGVQISVDGDATATLDSESVARAVDNLLRNAVEASNSGEAVAASIVEENDEVEVRVEDHGKGVSEERAVELFEPFFTTKPDGTGLGLAISRAIARAHGGELTYARIGATTRFQLSLARDGKRPEPRP
jgi:signal transduction histidine kinase